MNIVWGMPTLIEFDSLKENIELCVELELDFIELNMNLPEYQPDTLDIEKLLYFKNKYNIFYTIHLPEELDIACFNSDVRKAQLKVFRKVIDLSKELNVPIMNMHMNPGIHFTLPNEKIYLYEKYKAKYMKSISYFADFVNQLLKDSNLNLSIENTGIYDVDYIISAVDELIQRDKIVLTWDIGHDYSSGGKDEYYIKNNIHRLKHMHIHDAIDKNNHLPLFCGNIDIEDRLRIANETKSTCVIETKTSEGLRKSVAILREKGITSTRFQEKFV